METPFGRGTGKRLRQITAELAGLDILVCPNTVRRLLDQLGYGLHANAKTLSTECPERDEQFVYMAEEKSSSSGAARPSSASIPKKN